MNNKILLLSCEEEDGGYLQQEDVVEPFTFTTLFKLRAGCTPCHVSHETGSINWNTDSSVMGVQTSLKTTLEDAQHFKV
jgi:hypothetical protein